MGYLYTFAALAAVSGLLVLTFMDYADAVRLTSEINQLRRLCDAVTSASIQLLALTETVNASSRLSIQLPSNLGSRQYWLQLGNDSSRSWVQGGLGNVPSATTETRVYLPKKTVATGTYVCGFGAAVLVCSLNAGSPHLHLFASAEGG